MESLVSYLPSNLFFLKKNKASCSLYLKHWEEGQTYKEDASLHLQIETPVFWPIFPYSLKLLIWFPALPLAPSDSRYSLTLVRMTFRSSAPLFFSITFTCIFVLPGWGKASLFPKTSKVEASGSHLLIA